MALAFINISRRSDSDVVDQGPFQKFSILVEETEHMNTILGEARLVQCTQVKLQSSFYKSNFSSPFQSIAMCLQKFILTLPS